MAVGKPQLVGKGYVGSTLRIGLTLAAFSLLALVVTICCTIYSVKEAFDERSSLIILPSIPLYTGGHLAVRALYIVSHVLLNLAGSVIVAMSFNLQQLCASPSYEVIRRAVTLDGGDVPFGSPLPTIVSLFRRFRRSVPVICVWLLLLTTSLVMHLCLNGAIGFQYNIQHYYVDVIPVSELNPILFTLANWTNTTATQCQSDLRSILAINVDTTNITLIVDNGAPVYYLDYFDVEYGPAGPQLHKPKLDVHKILF
jgi:hypothetical protein